MYTAIYRDFRPDSFEKLVGQDHIVRILKSQIASGQTGHAYLFCGTRGTGKTTTARILAKALNCERENPAERPCCECASCRAIREGSFMDVIEIDAASNNGVDNIRELRESVKYPPAIGRNKVYIIDEVHMLSAGAFNALLKTLEEPPENVVFILATTEPQKLPATILSRCMRLDFRRVSEKTIIGNMKMICDARGIQAEDAALALIAVNADGSVRDSLSILEQCISTGDKIVTRDDVAEMLGTAGEETMIELTGHVMRGEVAPALLLLDRIISSGCDVKQFMREWLAHFRNLLMAKFVGNPEETLNMSLENAERVTEQSREVTVGLLNRGITELTETISESRWSPQPRVMLEMCIVRLGTWHEGPDAAAGSAAADKTAPQWENGAAADKTSPTAGGKTTAGRQRAESQTLSDEDRYFESLTAIAADMDEAAGAGGGRALTRTGSGAESTAAAAGGPDAAAGSGTADKTPPAADGGEEDQAAGSVPAQELRSLWNTVVKKAVGERPMLIRIENRSELVGIDDRNFFVAVQDEMTVKIIKEKGREILEKKMEEYYGKHLKLSLAKHKGVPLAKDDDDIENIAGQIREKFHMDVEIKP